MSHELMVHHVSMLSRPVINSSGDIELHLTLAIAAFSSPRERVASVAAGMHVYREILGMHDLVDLLGGKQAIRVVQVIQVPVAKRGWTRQASVSS